jgi:hypothetical protein
VGSLARYCLREAQGGIMKKPKKNSRGNALPRGNWVSLYQDLTESAAWKSLGANGQALYVHIATKYKGKNNGELACAIREASQAMNISKDTVARAIKILIDRGFIEIVKRSAFNLKCGPGKAAEYRLTEYPCNVTGKAATYKFKKWRRGKNGKASNDIFSRSHQKDGSVSPEGPISLTRGTEANSGID